MTGPQLLAGSRVRDADDESDWQWQQVGRHDPKS
jgi:hypothetical protein